jgi:hypothetical protein
MPAPTTPTPTTPVPTTPQANPFTVAGVRVDVTAANAVDARKQAFEQAQQAAFSLLASRFLTKDRMTHFKAPPVEQITPLVDDFEITNEKLSPTRYVGTYTFRFRPDASRNLINAQMYSQDYTQNYTQNPYPGAMPYHDDNGVYNPNAAAGDTPHAAYNPNAAYDPNGVYNPNTAYRPASPYPAMAAPPAAMKTAFKIRVHFSSIGEWIQMQKTLRAITGVTDLKIISLTPSYALIDLYYQQTQNALTAALAATGMTLQAEAPAQTLTTALSPALTTTTQPYNPYAAALNATASAVNPNTVYDLVQKPQVPSPVMPFPANPPQAAYRNPAYANPAYR